jgi:hypothetical protein
MSEPDDNVLSGGAQSSARRGIAQADDAPPRMAEETRALVEQARRLRQEIEALNARASVLRSQFDALMTRLHAEQQAQAQARTGSPDAEGHRPIRRE